MTLIIFRGPEGFGIRHKNTAYGHQIFETFNDALFAAITRFEGPVEVLVEGGAR